MIFAIHNHLREHIIHILAKAPNLTESEIATRLTGQELGATTQGIYRALRELEEDGVLVKERQQYSLVLAWILDIKSLANTMESVYFSPTYFRNMLPQSTEEKRVWHFSNLLRMQDFRSQLLIALAEISTSKIGLQYSPYAWYELAQAEKEAQFIKT